MYRRCEPHWLSKLDVLGACLPGGSLKNLYHQMHSPNPTLLRKKLEIVSSLLVTVCHHTRAGVYVKIVFQALLQIWCVFYSLVLLMFSSYSINFWISFRGNYFVCSCRFGMSGGGGEFISLLHFYLELEPHEFILYRYKLSLSLSNNAICLQVYLYLYSHSSLLKITVSVIYFFNLLFFSLNLCLYI